MNKRELLSPADDTASHALVDVQTAITRVKTIISECVSKGVTDEELTRALNNAIGAECNKIKDKGFKEQFRKSLVVSARKWHYELSQTYKILDRNLEKQALKQPFNIDLSNLTRLTPYEKQIEFRKLLDDGTNVGIPVIKDYQQSVRLAVKALSADPPKIITPKNGKPYFMSARLRAEMAARYSAAVENLQWLRNEGVNFCWISSHASCSPRCAPFQGKLYSLFEGKKEIDGKEYGESGVIDGIPYRPINEALSGVKGDGNGCISGYGCRHRAIEYERGSKAPADYTEAEMKREYAIDKQQRSYENRIRQMKQEERQLRAMGMEKEASALRKKWRILTKEYQIYSIEHDRAYYPYRYVIDRTEENGLTIFESDVIITSENIKRQLGAKTLTLQEVIQNADESVARAFGKYQSQLKIVDAHYKRDKDHNYHFDPQKGGILFDIDEDSAPSDDYRKQFQTYFHETGHNLDFVIGKKIGVGYASGGYKSPTFNATFNQMIVEEGMEFIEAYREVVFKQKKMQMVSNEETYKAIHEDFKGIKLVDKGQLSDILDGITNGKMRECGFDLGAGHTQRNKNYWKNHPVGGEAFAHFTSIIAVNSNMLERYMAYFPKSFEIFKEIMQL